MIYNTFLAVAPATPSQAAVRAENASREWQRTNSNRKVTTKANTKVTTTGNTEEWYQAIPEEVRPRKDQPFYHLYAENDQTVYEAYVSEQNLLPDDSGESLRHPQIRKQFKQVSDGQFKPTSIVAN